MNSPGKTDRLVVVGGWGVRAEMLSEIYRHWPGPIELVSLDDALIAQCESVAEVADELLSLYSEPSVWMGWSLGAQVVMEVALRRASAVSAVITLAGFPRFVANESWPWGMSADLFGAFRSGLISDSGRYWSRFVLLMISGASSSERGRLQAWLAEGPPVSAGNLVKSLEWLGHTDQCSLWAQVRVPVLHITGACDQIVAPRRSGLSSPLSATEVCIPGMAHWPGGEFSEDCLGAIAPFLHNIRTTQEA